MKRPMFWILLGCALLSLPLSGCYTRLGYSGSDPYASDYDDYYDDYSGSYNWIDAYYDSAPTCWGFTSFDQHWWYSDYHPTRWHHHHNDHDYDTYDQVSEQNGWTRGQPEPRTPRGGIVGGGGGGGAVTVDTPAPATQSRNPGRKDESKATKAETKKSPTKEKSRKNKKRGWGR